MFEPDASMAAPAISIADICRADNLAFCLSRLGVDKRDIPELEIQPEEIYVILLVDTGVSILPIEEALELSRNKSPLAYKDIISKLSLITMASGRKRYSTESRRDAFDKACPRLDVVFSRLATLASVDRSPELVAWLKRAHSIHKIIWKHGTRLVPGPKQSKQAYYQLVIRCSNMIQRVIMDGEEICRQRGIDLPVETL